MSSSGIHSLPYWRRPLIATVLFTLAACASAPARQLPVLQLQAIRHNEQGLAAEQRRDSARALAEFTEAYRLHSAIDNHPGMVTSLINISRLSLLNGDVTSARGAAARALSLVDAVPELASEIHFEQAKILLLDGKTLAAAAAAERAIAAASEENTSRMVNLLAEIRFSEGALPAVRAHAEEGLKLARGTGNSREEANALRLLGEVALSEKRPAEATERFSLALIIDKELGLSGKIRTDLLGLARTSEAVGDLRGAIGYLQRAVDVSMAGGDLKQIKAVQERLADLLDKAGDKARADKVRGELTLQ